MLKQRLAIFDIDGTIFRSSLLIELINGLVEHGVFPQKAKQEMEKEYLAWLDRKGEYDDYLAKVIQIHLKYIQNKKYADVNAVAEQVVKFMKNRVYRYTRDLLKKLKTQNFHIITISGSPTYIVSKFAKAFGFQAYFGSEYEVQNGRFTGKVLNLETFYKKAHVLNLYIENKKLKVNFKKSLAVGDTESDVAMLELVGSPIAFNPNSGLARIAKERGWKVIVEKDVIYEINQFNFLHSHGSYKSRKLK